MLNILDIQIYTSHRIASLCCLFSSPTMNLFLVMKQTDAQADLIDIPGGGAGGGGGVQIFLIWTD